MPDDLNMPEPLFPVEPAAEKSAEPEWRALPDLPVEGRLVEVDTGGGIEKVRHVNGRWLPDGQQQGVNVKRWRLIA